MTKHDYQVVVIGAGSGGLVAAEFAAKLGVRVALVEAQRSLGGECLHTGCVPSKALIHTARVAWAAGHSEAVGVKATPQVDFRQAMRHVNGAISTIENSHDNDTYYEQLGIDVIHGEATFTDKHTIQVGDRTLRAKRFIIATGSKAAVPKVTGLSDGPFLTNKTIFQLKELPESLLVVGGGPIGCELGQALAMLGSRVTILQAAPRLLPRDEIEASELLAASLKEMGVIVHAHAQIEDITYSKNGQVTANLKNGVSVTATQLLIATGRTAIVPNGLDKAGVVTNPRGVSVDKHLRTSNKRIFAIGDCNGGVQFTHAAGQQAAIAIQNALMGLQKSFDVRQIPWTTFTTPEIAHLGATKGELNTSHAVYESLRANYRDIDKAVTENEQGFIEVLLGKHQRILGATVVGVNAAEILAQIITAKSWDNFKDIVQPYPTYATGLRQEAASINLTHLLSSQFGKLVKRYIELRVK